MCWMAVVALVVVGVKVDNGMGVVEGRGARIYLARPEKQLPRDCGLTDRWAEMVAWPTGVTHACLRQLICNHSSPAGCSLRHRGIPMFDGHFNARHPNSSEL